MPLRDGDRDGAADGAGTAAARARLGAAAAGAFADLRLAPVLRELLGATAEAAGASAGAVSLVDAAAGTYVKAAERGVTCQVGRTFPLDEGATGRAVALRRPVVLRDYADLAAGHLPAGTAAGHRSVLAVPAWWRGEVIAVNIVFRPPGLAFPTAVVDAVEALTQVVAPALHLAAPERTLAAALSRSGARVRVVGSGGSRPVPDAVATAAGDVLTVLDAVLGDRAADPAVRVGVLHRTRGPRLLVQREAAGGPADATAVLAALRAALGTRADAVAVEHAPGWGVAVQVDLAPAAPEPTALTDREREVLGLLRHGLTDRAIAAALGRSPRTVEKHVGALVRKTGAANRTAAVVAALERGWLPGG